MTTSIILVLPGMSTRCGVHCIKAAVRSQRVLWPGLGIPCRHLSFDSCHVDLGLCRLNHLKFVFKDFFLFLLGFLARL